MKEGAADSVQLVTLGALTCTPDKNTIQTEKERNGQWKRRKETDREREGGKIGALT